MKILVALGGNAILKHGEKGTAEEQFSTTREASKEIVELIKEGHQIAVTHGNGPQVGDILLRNEIAKNSVPMMPLHVCGAESQGMLGYILQQCLDNEIRSVGLDVPTVSIITQAIVEPNDPAFERPSKPIGPFYTGIEAARLKSERRWVLVEDSGRGYRRVVPSPAPIRIVEADTIGKLFDQGVLVIQSGGGGIPVIMTEKGDLMGVEAVIDKDLSASLIASHLNLDLLMILTDVEKVSLHFGKANEVKLDKLTLAESERYMQEGQFPSGSMGPKVQAAMNFVRATGHKAIITSLETAIEALRGETGTTISLN